MTKTIAIILFAITLLAVIGRGVTVITEHAKENAAKVAAAVATQTAPEEEALSAFSAVFGAADFEAAAELAPRPAEGESAFAAYLEKGEIYDIVKDEYIVFYETYFSKQPVVTNISARRMERLTTVYACSLKKMQAMLLLENLLSLNGKTTTLSALTDLTPGEALALATTETKAYLARLSDEERDAIKRGWEAMQ